MAEISVSELALAIGSDKEMSGFPHTAARSVTWYVEALGAEAHSWS